MPPRNRDILASARREMARQQLQALLIFLGIGIVIMFGVGLVLRETETIYLTVTNFGLLAAIVGLRHRERLTAASFLAGMALVATATWGTATSRFGLLDSTVILFAVAVMYLTLLLPSRQFALSLALAVVAILLVGFRGKLGLSSTGDSQLTLPIDVAVVVVSVVIMAFALRRQNDMHWKTLQRAVANERDLAASHAELQERQVQVEASEQRWRSLVTAAPDWILQLDGDGTIAFANRPGFFDGDPVGHDLEELVAPEDRRALKEALAAAITEGRASSLELELQKDGDQRRGAFHLGPLGADRAGGGGAIVLVSDVTERHQLQAQLLQTQKLDSIGQLAGGIAHDFNNLLTVIGGHADLVQSKLAAHDPLQQDLETILQTCQHASALTRQILAFSRRQPLRPEAVDLDGALTRMRRMLGRLIGEDIQLTESFAPDLPPIDADPGSVEQVVMNLVLNARDAIRARSDAAERRIDIATALRTAELAQAGDASSQSHRTYVELAVRDTGIGMDEELKSRVFEPFFTTKDPGRGTGLGLATVYGIVTQSGGEIRVESSPGQGATFRVLWPVSEQPSGAASAATAFDEEIGGDEHLLLVEDDDAVRKLAETALRRHGYRVTAVSEARAALERCRGDHGFAMVVTDVVMPEMNGYELRNRLPADLPVLFCSGHTELSWLPEGTLPPPEIFLAKPYTPQQMARKVRRLLDASKSR